MQETIYNGSIVEEVFELFDFLTRLCALHCHNIKAKLFSMFFATLPSFNLFQFIITKCIRQRKEAPKSTQISILFTLKIYILF